MKRAGLVLLLLMVLAAAALVLTLRKGRQGPPQVQQTTAGEFQLLEITVAGQPYEDGSAFQRVVERFVPRGGVRIGDLRIGRVPRRKSPNSDAPMTAWLLYRGTNIARGKTPPLFGAKVVVQDLAGKQFENEVPYVQRSTTNEMLIALPLVSFPTDQKSFLLQFSPPPPARSGTNRMWVEFTTANPLYGAALTWTANPLPQTNEVEGLSFVLKEVILQPATFEFQLPGSDWRVGECTLNDANGNQFRATRSRSHSTRTLSSHWSTFQQRLDTNQSWTINLSLVNNSEVPPESERILHLTADVPQSITNQNGQAASVSFNGFTITLTAPEEKGRLGWMALAATNSETLEPIRIGRFAPAMDGGVQRWPVSRTAHSNIIVRLGYPKRLKTAFSLNPNGTAVSAKSQK